ncbi:MAG TPA: hypothetical protein VGA58_05355 [bacterium]
MVAIKAGGAVQLISRNGRDHTRRVPELVKAGRAEAEDLHPRRRGSRLR